MTNATENAIASGLSKDRQHAEAYTNEQLAGQLRSLAREQSDRRKTEILYEAARRLMVVPLRTINCGELQIDPEAQTVTLAGQAVELTRIEYELLLYVASDPQHIFTVTDLLRGVGTIKDKRALDVHALRLRRKLNTANMTRHSWMQNVWGIGYRLEGDQ